jgi:hypothetical protein
VDLCRRSQVELLDTANTLQKVALTDEQIQNIKEFRKRVTQGLQLIDCDFATKREIIELLEVQVTLKVENGKKVAYAQCYLGEKSLSIAAATRSARIYQDALVIK